jgi:hypothetical protein
MAKKKIKIKKVWIGGALYALLFAGITQRIEGGDNDNKCGGEELWDQKVLIDAESSKIKNHPEVTSIKEINGIDSDVERRTKNNPRLDFEEKMITVKNVLIRKVILEDDNDYHLVVQDRDGNHLIAEIVDPECRDAQSSDFIDNYYKVRSLMEKHADDFQHWTFNITGVLFKDRSHGQTGKADNDIEIHPILKLVPTKYLNY